MKKQFKISKAFNFGRGDNLVLVIPKAFEKKMNLTEDTRFFTYIDKDKIIYKKLKLDVM
jgi:bifunctional DNA-binding transcriptional regulator/antitoxin component of YhaV-PrlF toxin-antitoxin module